MHRIAIGDPQCFSHQLLAKLLIGMVDGESLWREFYLQGRASPFGARPPATHSACRSPGLSGCGYGRCLFDVWNCVHVDISLGNAHRRRARFGNAQAIIRRGEPMQLQWWKGFCLQSRRTARCRAGPWASYKLREDELMPLICPTCQNVFAGSLKTSPPATLGYFAWGCFRYFSWERAPRR
jgi:hypothetical protein